MKLAWSIQVPASHLLTIRLITFKTQAGRDFLRIYRGTVPNIGSEALYEFSGKSAISEMEFNESVTLLFTTGGYSTNLTDGFEFSFSIIEASACLRTIVLKASNGRVRSPTFDNEVSQGKKEICWLFTAREFIGINFHRLDLDSLDSSGKVFIYVNTDVPNKEKEVLQLSNSDALTSEFWLATSWSVLIRLRATKIPTVEFSYRTNSTQQRSMNPLLITRRHRGILPYVLVMEKINSESGSRSSISGYRSYGYRSYGLLNAHYDFSKFFTQIWVINAKLTETVTIRFGNLSTKFNQGQLQVFAGPYETMYGSTRRNVLASSKKEVEYQLLGGAVIVYSSDVSAKHSGFDFEFNIGHRIYPIFEHWSGKVSRNSSTKLIVQSSVANYSIHCRLRPACGNRSFDVTMIHSNEQCLRAVYSVYSSNLPSFEFCARDAQCGFIRPFGVTTEELKHEAKFLEPDPESVIIDLKQPQFASVTGAVQFRAISRLACPSVKHRCELQTTDGKSITAQLIKKNITEPTEPQCLSLVTSQFVAVAQPSVITGAVIRCRLFDGSFERLKLPQQTTNVRLQGVWELPLLISSSTIAVISLIALSAVSYFLFKSLKAKRSKSIEMNIRPQPKPNPYKKHPASEVYLN
ncbi:hypothetical protein BOX15_Mlig017866g1 [Macrostomum lignano]|uniref:CUB domain-containing protein n=1 Tax=Macrostomum lignano TaxID=282301 RepID=A0A267GLU7_9PLAT|nr:hypothetical protein BOX15_Mlig017866g1 [Macrostomum lignano]